MKDTFEAIVERETGSLKKQQQKLERRIWLLNLIQFSLRGSLRVVSRAAKAAQFTHQAASNCGTLTFQFILIVVVLAGLLALFTAPWTMHALTRRAATDTAAAAAATVATAYRLAPDYAESQRQWLEMIALEDSNRELRQRVKSVKSEIHSLKLQRARTQSGLESLLTQLDRHQATRDEIAAQEAAERNALDALKRDHEKLAKQREAIRAEVAQLMRRHEELKLRIAEAGTDATPPPAGLTREIAALHLQKTALLKDIKELAVETALARQGLAKIRREIRDYTRELNGIINHMRNR